MARDARDPDQARDRLHNMRTMGAVDAAKRSRIAARDAGHLAAPIAHRLGLNQTLRVTELSFQHLRSRGAHAASCPMVQRARGFPPRLS